MTVTLYAQPYDVSANGFYFDDSKIFEKKIQNLKNDYREPVEEFEIQFIDGEALDAALFEALCIHQGTACQFLDMVPEWEEWEKINIIIAVDLPPRLGPSETGISMVE